MLKCKSGRIQRAVGFILLKLSIDFKVWKPGLLSNWPGLLHHLLLQILHLSLDLLVIYLRYSQMPWWEAPLWMSSVMGQWESSDLGRCDVTALFFKASPKKPRWLIPVQDKCVISTGTEGGKWVSLFLLGKMMLFYRKSVFSNECVRIKCFVLNPRKLATNWYCFFWYFVGPFVKNFLWFWGM